MKSPAAHSKPWRRLPGRRSADAAARRRVDKALRDSLEQLEAERQRWHITLESMADPVIVCDASGSLAYINPAGVRLLGTSMTPGLRAEYHADSCQLCAADNKLLEVRDLPWQRALSERSLVQNFESRLHPLDGSEHTIIWSAACFWNTVGQLLGSVAVGRDITDLKAAEERLADTNFELEQTVQRRTAELAERAALLELSFDGIIVRDAEDRITYWNRGAEEMYGWRREAVLGKVTHQLFQTVFPEPVSQIKDKLYRQGRWFGELLHTRLDGSKLTVATRWSLQLDPAGQVAAILETNTDITERKRTEQALRERQRELSIFFEEAPLGLLWVDPHGKVLKVNRAMLNLLGRGASEIQGHDLTVLDADLDSTGLWLDRLRKGETVSSQPARLRHHRGPLKHVLIDANGYWEKGKLVYSRWFVRDITRRIELEQEILAISEREQRRIGQDLHDDLCQQLTGVEFLSQTLATALGRSANPEAEKAREIAAMLRFALVQTRELARGLSPLSLEADGLMVALQELTSRTAKLFGRNCSFICERPVLVGNQAVGVHSYRIAQEAVSNALKHSQADAVEVRLRSAGDGFILEVADNGVGLAAGAETAGGMGLRIMEYRAEMIGATLIVQGNPNGRGTCVRCEVGKIQSPFVEKTSA